MYRYKIIYGHVLMVLGIIGCKSIPNSPYHSRRIQGENSLYYNYDLNFKVSFGGDFKIRNENLKVDHDLKPLHSIQYSFKTVNQILTKILHYHFDESNFLFQAQAMSGSFVKCVGVAYPLPKGFILGQSITKTIVPFLTRYRDTAYGYGDTLRLKVDPNSTSYIEARKIYTLFSFKRKSYGILDYYFPYQGKLIRFLFITCFTDGYYFDYEEDRFKYPHHAGNITKSKLEIFEEDFAEPIMHALSLIKSPTKKKIENDPFSIAHQAFSPIGFPNYLLPLIELRKLKPNKSDQNANTYYQQAFQTYQSLAGNYDSVSSFPFQAKSITAIDTLQNNLENEKTFYGYRPMDARDYILLESINKSLVMFNEAHTNYQHRKFEESLLPDFYKAGFRYLAVEALSYYDSLLNQRKYPISASGFYSHEPSFGNFLRRALKLGFKLVPYEDTTHCPVGDNCVFRRDSLQAINILRILKKDPQAKILVHAGYAHIEKKPSQNWRPMAFQLRQLSGINPFCINQTQLSLISQNAKLGKINFINSRFKPRRPCVLINQLGNTWMDSLNQGMTDLLVYNPYSPNLFETDSDQYYSKKLTLEFPEIHGSNQELMVQVYVLDEYNRFEKQALPVFQKSFLNTYSKFSIYLPENEYIIIHRDRDGNRIYGQIL